MKKSVLFLVVVLAVAAVVPAFAQGEDISIGVVYKQSGNAYFQAGVEGFQQAADELGYTFMHDGPDDGSSDGQIRIIENYITQGVDVLAISANDPAALVDVLAEAMDEGIAVISWDAKVDAEGRNLDIEPASAKTIGVTQLESIVKSIGGEGQIAIVSAMATAPNQNLWIKYIQEELESNPDYANVDLVEIVYGDDEYTKSYDETQGLLNKYPDLKGIITPTTAGGPAVAKCVQDSGRDIKVTGLTLASDMKEYIDAGIVDESFLWNPIELGYATGYAAVAMVNGDLTGAEGETFDVPGIGTLTCEDAGDGGTIAYLNKLNVFNTETVNDWIDIL